MSDKIKNLQTSVTGRRLSIAKASLLAGSRWAKASASSFFDSPDEKERKRKQALQEQANYLISEIGKLKGSVVKMGQMMALYGEHFLPDEITDALNQLNNNTVALEWSIIHQILQEQLGSKIHDLDIDPEPLGTASLAQVHRATHKQDGRQLVLKVQYPQVANAIDSDMALFKNLLKITRVVPQTQEFNQWFEEVRQMMHNEMDYQLEAETTERFRRYLADDPRYIIPQIYPEYSTKQVLCMSYEHGISINDPALLQISQQRRNAIGQAALEIIIREILQWGEMQTDPNFGNYLIRLADSSEHIDQIVLLDFGAIRQFDAHLLKIARQLVQAGHSQNHQQMMSAMTGYDYFDTLPYQAKYDMARVFLMASESFTHTGHSHPIPAQTFTEQQLYDWKNSQLHSRILQFSKEAVKSTEFTVPPKEFMFISRKFIGGYTFMSVLQAQTNIEPIIAHYLNTQA